MKKVIKYMLKQRGGIHTLIALKAMYEVESGGSYSLYRMIRSALDHKHTPEQIYYNLTWQLSMTKEFAQYQY